MPDAPAGIRQVCERAAKRIAALGIGEPEETKKELYARAKKWVDAAAEVAELPDPFTGRDWALEVKLQRGLLHSGNREPLLRREVESDLNGLEGKLAAYDELYRRGKVLVDTILTKGLVGASENGSAHDVDYGLLAVLEPLRDVETGLMKTVKVTESAIRENGSAYQRMNPELGNKVATIRDGLEDAIAALSLCTKSSLGAVKIARERKIEDGISMAEGKALLDQALNDGGMSMLAKDIEELINGKKAALPGCEYVEVRLRHTYGKGAYAVDGEVRGSGEGGDLQFGVKVIAKGGGTMSGRADFGSELSINELNAAKGQLRIKKAIDAAYELAVANANEKRLTKNGLDGAGPLAGAITDDVKMAQVAAVRETIGAEYGEHPMAADMGKLISDVKAISKEVGSLSPTVKKNAVYVFSEFERRLFVNSDGSSINESNVKTQGGYYVVAQERGKMPDFRYADMGGEGGFEVLCDDKKNGSGKTFHDFVLDGARETLELAGAEFFPQELADGSGELKVYEKNGKLFSDGTIVPARKAPHGDRKHSVLVKPSAGALMQHETSPIGHGDEDDRRFGLANNYAGYTWLGNFRSSMIGKRVASPLITGGFNPLLPHAAHYHFDWEGVPAREVILVRNGILEAFMNNRETAGWSGAEPTGSARATEESRVPLIRMGNMFIRDGDTPYEEMIAKMGDGYILETNSTPSINAGRSNAHFEIKKVTPVRGGRIIYDERTGQPKVYRGAGMLADSLDFWDADLRAVGDDGTWTTLPNCGKGEGGEMQAIAVSHYMPSLLTKAELTAGQCCTGNTGAPAALTETTRAVDRLKSFCGSGGRYAGR